MKKNAISIIIVMILALVFAAPGCGKSHKSSRSATPSAGGGGGSGGTGSGTGTGSGGGNGGTGTGGGGSGTGGGTATGETVPGNIDVGLASAPEAPRMVGGTADEQKVAELINEFRAENGLHLWTWDDGIADCERSHAYDCEQQGYFGHGAKASPKDYNICNERGRFLGIGPVLESAAQGVCSSPSGIVNCWKNSPPHRAQLLADGNTRHGAGISVNEKYAFHASQ